MKTIAFPIICTVILAIGSTCGCAKIEIIGRPPAKSLADSIRFSPTDTTKQNATTEEADTTRYPISFDVTVEDWETVEDSITVEI